MNAVVQTYDEPCVELVGWQNPYLMLGNAVKFYVHEHLIAQGRDPKRIVIVAKHAFRLFGPEIDVTKIDRAKVRDYTAARTAEGAKGATVRRELAMLQASINHNLREERIAKAPKFVKPPPSEPRIRWLTREEHQRLMAQPMEYRIRMFLILAFGTGARSKAIEELEWSRVDLAARTIDFRVPGVKYRNKRRALDDDEAPVCPVADPGSPEGAAVWRNYDRDEAAWRARRVASRLDDFAGSTLEELRSLSKKEARAPQTVATILALVAEIDRLRKRLEECPPMEFPK